MQATPDTACETKSENDANADHSATKLWPPDRYRLLTAGGLISVRRTLRYIHAFFVEHALTALDSSKAPKNPEDEPDRRFKQRKNEEKGCFSLLDASDLAKVVAIVFQVH